MKRLILLLVLLALLVMPTIGQLVEARVYVVPPYYPYPYGSYGYHYPYYYPAPVIVWGCQVRETRPQAPQEK